MEIGVGSDVLTIEERTINGKIFDGLLVLRNEFFIVERDVLVEWRFVLDDNEKILDYPAVLRKS